MKDPEKIKAREQALLARLKKERRRSNFPWYLTGLLVCLILLVILDSFSTNCPNSLQSAVVNEFFVQGQGLSFQEGLSRLSLARSPLMLLSILATLMLAVSDRVGRKPMLLISAIGMTAGMLWVGLSQSFGAYIFGSAMITFFVSFDMHQLYIVEVAPADKRATWQALSQFFGQLAVASVGVMRLLNTENDQIAWRNIHLIPAAVGVVVVVLLVLFVRESDVFLTQRIAFLETPYEQRTVHTGKKEKQQSNNGGLGKAFGYIFKDRQMRWVILSLLLFRLAIPAFSSYYEPIMTAGSMTTDMVSFALIFMAVFSGTARLSAGFVSDRMGRKNSSILYSVIAVAAMIAFIFAARAGAPSMLVGILLGVSTGAYWTVGDQIGLLMNESAPTGIRGSVTAAAGLIQVVIAIVAMVFAGVMVGLVDAGLFCVVYGAVILALATLLLIFKVRETRGVEMDKIG